MLSVCELWPYWFICQQGLNLSVHTHTLRTCRVSKQASKQAINPQCSDTVVGIKEWVWSGLSLHPRPSINIHQSRICSFATFGARATQRQHPIASKLGSLERVYRGWVHKSWLWNLHVESQLQESLMSLLRQVLSTVLQWLSGKFAMETISAKLHIGPNFRCFI